MKPLGERITRRTMPNPNAIISMTVTLEPPLDRAPEELLSAEAGILVELEIER